MKTNKEIKRMNIKKLLLIEREILILIDLDFGDF